MNTLNKREIDLDIKLSAGVGTKWLMDQGYPYKDQLELMRSGRTYDCGGFYGVEIPVINSFEVLEGTIRAIKDEGIEVTRFNETLGSLLLSDGEIKDMLALCSEKGYGILFSMGPRPEYDVKSSFARSQFGLEMGRRINNNDGIRASVEEAVRLSELGCRGITVYDVGVMSVLNEMRQQGYLPADMIFKTSTHCMATNPFLAKIMAQNGADSVTTAHDLGLPVIQEIRRLNSDLALDVPTDVYKSKGGFIRFYELSEIVQIASPVMLKMGASAQGHPYDAVGEKTTRERVRRVAQGLHYLNKYLPQLQRISPTSKHYALPAKA